MQQAKPFLSLLCAFVLLTPSGMLAADNPPKPDQNQPDTEPHGVVSRITKPYKPRELPPNSMANSNRIDALMRAGNLYLSLEDTVALALENNIDIAIQRYGPQIADAALMAAQAGGSARGVSTTVTAGPTSASVNATGTTPGTNQNAASQASVATSSAVGGAVLQSSGPAIPNLDPVLTAAAS